MLSEIESLSLLMFERLFWARMIAALKYGKQPIEDKQRERKILELIENRCSKEKYSHKMKSIMLSFFQFNIELSKFVQEAYFLKWNHLSEAEMRIVHQESSKIIQSEAQYDVDHIEFVRKKIMTINRKMLKKLMNIQKNISRNLYENA